MLGLRSARESSQDWVQASGTRQSVPVRREACWRRAQQAMRDFVR